MSFMGRQTPILKIRNFQPASPCTRKVVYTKRFLIILSKQK